MENAIFLIDVLNILPQEVDCFIKAPSLDDEIIIKMMVDSEVDHCKLIKLNSFTRDIFIERIKNNPDVIQYFHSLEIKSFDNKKLFEAWDGVEYGAFSKEIKIPDWFEEKYFNKEMYYTSDEW